MKVLIHILLSFILAGPLLAQPISSYLDTTYNLDGRSDWFFGICNVGGKYYASSWTNANGISDYGITRLDVNGLLDSLHIFYDTTTYENAIDLVKISDGRMALAVQHRPAGIDDWDFKLAIVDTNFNLITTDIRGTASIGELPQTMCNQENRIVLAGGRREADTLNVYIAAWDTAGNFLWDSEIGNPITDETCFGITATSDGGYLLAGTRSLGGARYDWLIIKTDSLGNQEWEKTFGGSGSSRAQSIIKLSNGRYLVTGYKYISSGGYYDGQLICLSEQGHVFWNYTYTHPYRKGLFQKTIEADDGGFVTIGVLEDDTSHTDYGWLHKTDSLGQTEWSREIAHQYEDSQYLRDLEQTPDGGYLMVGSILFLPNDAWVVKVDSVGCVVEDCDSIKTGTPPEPIPYDLYLGNPVPNPTTGAVTISYQLPPGTSGIIQFMDIHDRVLQSYKVVEGISQLDLDLSIFPKGIIFCTLKTEQWPAQSRTIVIQ